MNLWNIAHLWTLHIYVLEFARLQNFCRFSKFGKLLTLPPDGRHRRLRRRHLPMWSRSNTESVFCRKLSKIYPPCQNPDRSSYRLLNRLARRARVVHQMKRAVWSKTLICRAEQYGSLMGQRPQELLWALLCSLSLHISHFCFKRVKKMNIVTDRRRPGPTESRSCCHSSSSHSSGWKSENKSQMFCIRI